MDYQVAFYEDSWKPPAGEATSMQDVVKHIVDTRDKAIANLRLPQGQEGKVDLVSCGIWLKVRTDRPREEGHKEAGFVPALDTDLHRPVPFSYLRTPLAETQIRLLEIFPAARGEALRATLHTVHLAEANALSFLALSYVWGDPQLSGAIFFNNASRERKQITANLEAALTALRDRHRPVFIWSDALCIDQENAEERTQQVRIMGPIFSSAAKVIIWLGDASEHSRYGMEVLQIIAKGEGFSANPPWKTHPPELVRAGLIDILGRSWFKRIWTVQEAALSSTQSVMMCSDGSRVEWPATPPAVYRFIRGLKFAAVSIDWSENGLAGSRDMGFTGVDLNELINLLGQQLHQLLRREGRANRAQPEPNLLDIAYEVKDRQCTDPRDRLYGVLGLALIRGANQLQPNYKKSWADVNDDFRALLLQAAEGRRFETV